MSEQRNGNDIDNIVKLLLAFLFLANCALIPAHDHHDALHGDFHFSSVLTEDNHHPCCHHTCEWSMHECCRFLGNQYTSFNRKISGPDQVSSGTILTCETDQLTPDRDPGSVKPATDRPVPSVSPHAHRLRAPPFQYTV